MKNNSTAEEMNRALREGICLGTDRLTQAGIIDDEYHVWSRHFHTVGLPRRSRVIVTNLGVFGIHVILGIDECGELWSEARGTWTGLEQVKDSGNVPIFACSWIC